MGSSARGRSRGSGNALATSAAYPGPMVCSGARAAKRDVRVLASGRPSNHATSRSILIAAAMATCCKCVFGKPR